MDEKEVVLENLPAHAVAASGYYWLQHFYSVAEAPSFFFFFSYDLSRLGYDGGLDLGGLDLDWNMERMELGSLIYL